MSNEIALPQFEVEVLDQNELEQVAGGLVCTCGTRSACHIDGADESD